VSGEVISGEGTWHWRPDFKARGNSCPLKQIWGDGKGGQTRLDVVVSEPGGTELRAVELAGSGFPILCCAATESAKVRRRVRGYMVEEE
jgi:hypothetical protein